MPTDARLEYWPKIGWGWELCIDAPEGSALLTWSGDSAGGGIKLRLASCVAAGKDRRNFLRATASADHIEFLFPEAPDHGSDFFNTQACPHTVTPETLARFKAILAAALDSGTLAPEAAQDATNMIALFDNVKLERLWLAGGEGNAESWSVRCKDISHTIPETNPNFPEHLKSGR